MVKSILAAYIGGIVSQPPVRKIRILCEILKGRQLPEDVAHKVDDVYAAAMALDSCEKWENPICIPWPFPKTKENFDRYIAPWLTKMPDFRYTNELEKRIKIGKLMNAKEPWEQFFLITTELNLTFTSLEELKVQFAKWAMGIIMYEALHRLESRDLVMGSDEDTYEIVRE